MTAEFVSSKRSSWIGNATVIIVAGALVMAAAMGARQSFGLFLGPFSFDRGLPLTVFAFAIALHNLVWGLAQPFAGAAADRFGTAVIVGFGAIVYAAGLALTALVPTGLGAVVGIGILVGIGLSCTTFGVVLAAVGRAVSPERRSMAMGVASAVGSIGQIGIVPLAQTVIDGSGVATGLLFLGIVVLLATPLCLAFGGAKAVPSLSESGLRQPSLGEALREAGGHRGYQLLTIGFFTCGLQLAFIGTHLPGYLATCHMPAALGATALAVIGLFNTIGSWLCGWLGARWRPQHLLAWLYLIRAAAIAALLVLPQSEALVLGFAAVMGLLWLGTVPLTSNLIARMFGVRHLGTLFGICFLSHQVGSFVGAWLGGYAFETTGSYTSVWVFTALAGLFAAAVHIPIRDRAAPGAPRPSHC
jgi:predicted MFS family arabinose efflux permease